MLFEVAAEESLPMIGHIFSRLSDLFPEVGDEDDIWHWIIDWIFEGHAKEVIDTYDKLCTYGNTVSTGEICSTADQAKQFFTDFVWLCNQR